MSIFNNENEFKPIVRFKKELPNYYVSESGLVLSTKRGQQLKAMRSKHMRLQNSGRNGSRSVGSNDQHLVCLQCDFSIPKHIFDDYDYSLRSSNQKSGRKLKVSSVKITVSVHRCVAETWMPIDKFPPASLADCWDDMPEAAKEWVRDTAVVDHIDDNPSNNHVSNLRWVTPKENNVHRKLQNEEV